MEIETDIPQEIGGRSTDLSQIGYCLRNELKESFPINEVPTALVDDLAILITRLEIAENEIKTFIRKVRKVEGQKDFMEI